MKHVYFRSFLKSTRSDFHIKTLVTIYFILCSIHPPKLLCIKNCNHMN
jgi:hypothetical protein